MKSTLKRLYFLPLAAVLVAAFALALMAQSPNGVHGAFTGNLQLPSPYTLTFGAGNSTTDVSIGKNGTNTLGVTGNIGGSGAVANTTITPAGPFAWGTVALVANTATVTFAKPFAVAPVCVVTDQTTAQLVKSAPTATTLVVSDTVGATDVIAWVCHGNPN